MTQSEFKLLFADQVVKCEETLQNKRKEYTGDNQDPGSKKNMVFTARLTQRGHLVHNMEDLIRLYNSSFTKDTIRNMGSLPHPTIQKFTVITVAVVGASRRFLSKIPCKQCVLFPFLQNWISHKQRHYLKTYLSKSAQITSFPVFQHQQIQFFTSIILIYCLRLHVFNTSKKDCWQ